MNSLYLKYAMLYNFSYMAIGAMTPMIGQYLKHIGFSGTQIGTITSTGTAVAIFATAFWGAKYSKSKRPHEILIALCIAAAGVCIVITGIKGFALFLMIFGIMYFFQSPVMSLTDAFTVERMQRFGTLRAWGAVGFALGVFLAGNAADLFGVDVIFVFYISCFILTAIMVMVIKKTSLDRVGEQIDREVSAGYIEILKNKQIRRLIICAFFMGGTNVANNTYFSFLYIESGGAIAGVGLAMLLMVGSEVPFMAWCEKLSSKFTMEKTILFAMVISVVRFCIYGLGVSWWVLIIMAFTQGAVNGILLIEFVRYVSKLAPEGSKSIAVSSYYIIGSNLSTIVCQLIGGVLLDITGAKGVYMFFGIFNLIGVILYLKFRLYIKEKSL